MKIKTCEHTIFLNITDNKKLLQQILQNIYKDVPYITCERLNNIKSIRIVRTNLVRKEATIHTIALENSGSRIIMKKLSFIS